MMENKGFIVWAYNEMVFTRHPEPKKFIARPKKSL